MVADVHNLMCRCALLLKQLEATKTMRVYISHNMDDNEELHSKLKSTEGELVTTQKVVDERVRLLRKTKQGKEAAEVETYRLKEEREATEAKHKKVEKENERLKQEMEELRVGFAAQKVELKGEY